MLLFCVWFDCVLFGYVGGLCCCFCFVFYFLCVLMLLDCVTCGFVGGFGVLVCLLFVCFVLLLVLLVFCGSACLVCLLVLR